MTAYVFTVAPQAYIFNVVEDDEAPNLEDAIRRWVMDATGFDADHVLWAEQTGARPLDGGAWASIRLGGLVPISAFDEVRSLTDTRRAPGTEIEKQVIARRELAVSIQFRGAATVGATTPLELALAAQASLGLPSARTALGAAGLSPFDIGAPVNITALVGTKFEGRALLAVRFYVTRTVSEHLGYIATVETEDFMGPPASGAADTIDI